jgi:hypothetical protein
MRQQENLGVLVPAPERLAMAWTCLPAATTAAQILDPIVLPQSVGYLHPTKKTHLFKGEQPHRAPPNYCEKTQRSEESQVPVHAKIPDPPRKIPCFVA